MKSADGRLAAAASISRRLAMQTLQLRHIGGKRRHSQSSPQSRQNAPLKAARQFMGSSTHK
jgi:hypothetical protein